MAYDSIFKTLYNSEKSCKFICKQRKKHRKKMTNTKMLTVIFFSRRQHSRCLSFPLSTSLYLGSRMTLNCFHHLRNAVKLFLKGCGDCYSISNRECAAG